MKNWAISLIKHKCSIRDYLTTLNMDKIVTQSTFCLNSKLFKMNRKLNQGTSSLKAKLKPICGNNPNCSAEINGFRQYFLFTTKASSHNYCYRTNQPLYILTISMHHNKITWNYLHHKAAKFSFLTEQNHFPSDPQYQLQRSL